MVGTQPEFGWEWDSEESGRVSKWLGSQVVGGGWGGGRASWVGAVRVLAHFGVYVGQVQTRPGGVVPLEGRSCIILCNHGIQFSAVDCAVVGRSSREGFGGTQLLCRTDFKAEAVCRESCTYKDCHLSINHR